MKINLSAVLGKLEAVAPGNSGLYYQRRRGLVSYLAYCLSVVLVGCAAALYEDGEISGLLYSIGEEPAPFLLLCAIPLSLVACGRPARAIGTYYGVTAKSLWKIQWAVYLALVWAGTVWWLLLDSPWIYWDEFIGIFFAFAFFALLFRLVAFLMAKLPWRYGVPNEVGMPKTEEAEKPRQTAKGRPEKLRAARRARQLSR